MSKRHKRSTYDPTRNGGELHPSTVCHACSGTGTFVFRDGRAKPCTNCVNGRMSFPSASR